MATQFNIVTSSPRDTDEQHPAVTRLGLVGGAVLAAFLVWLVVRVGFGLDVRSPSFNGQHFKIGPPLVIVTAAIFSLLGWGLLVLLERITSHGPVIWVVIAVAALMVSLAAPLSGTGVATGDRAALVLMHLTTGTVLIPGLYLTSRRR